MKLEIDHSPDPTQLGRAIELDASTPVTIGRDPNATIRIAGDGASRRHARIEKVGEDWVVYDEGSTNGIRVNDLPVQTAVLARGDRLWVGGTLFSFAPERIIETDYVVRSQDGLTGLANLRQLRERLTALLAEESRAVALLLLNVVGMKRLNDAHGYLAGDGLLKVLTQRLCRAAPPEALVARSGGDEFAIVLESAQLDEAVRLGEELRARVCAEAFIVGDVHIHANLHIGVATQPRTAEAILRVAKNDGYARRNKTYGATESIEWAAGLWEPQSRSTVDVAAACDGVVFAVADGDCDRNTGWLGARFVVRTVLERLGQLNTLLLGAADLIPEPWGFWTRSREEGEQLYSDCVQALGACPPGELAALFAAIDGVFGTVLPPARVKGMLVSTTAGKLEGKRVIGAHAGLGRASVLRANADQFEELAIPHYLHLVGQRMTAIKGLDPTKLPRRVLCSGLGCLNAEVGIDSFESELESGDLLLLTSGDLDLADAELLALLRTAVPLAERARMIERRLDQLLAATEPLAQPSEVAFTLVVRC